MIWALYFIIHICFQKGWETHQAPTFLMDWGFLVNDFFSWFFTKPMKWIGRVPFFWHFWQALRSEDLRTLQQYDNPPDTYRKVVEFVLIVREEPPTDWEEAKVMFTESYFSTFFVKHAKVLAFLASFGVTKLHLYIQVDYSTVFVYDILKDRWNFFTSYPSRANAKKKQTKRQVKFLDLGIPTTDLFCRSNPPPTK